MYNLLICMYIYIFIYIYMCVCVSLLFFPGGGVGCAMI